MTDKGFQQGSSEPVLGVPVDQNDSVDKLPVVSAGFCVPHDVVFVLQANLNPRSTEIYNVVDSANAMQFRVLSNCDRGSAMYIVDKEGRCVLTLKSKTFSAHNKWYIFSGQSTHKDDKIATVKPEEGSVQAEVFLKGKAKRHADVGSKATPVADFVMEGNRNVTYGKIVHQEDGYSRPVAELNKINQQPIQRGQPRPNYIDSYSLHTLPGIDSVFMLAVTIALDESIFSSQLVSSYGPYGYGGYGYGGGMGYGGMGYGGPMLLGAGLLATPFMLGGMGMGMGGFW